jgi:hypothetical protein
VNLAPAALDPACRRLTLLAVCIGQGMILLDTIIVNVALPAIQRGLRVTPGALTLGRRAQSAPAAAR